MATAIAVVPCYAAGASNETEVPPPAPLTIVDEADGGASGVSLRDNSEDVMYLEMSADERRSVAQSTARPTQGAGAVLTARLPVVVDGRRFASIPVTATITEVLTVSAISLADALAPIISDEGRQLLVGLGPNQVPTATLAEAGILVRLDPQTLSVVVELPASLRGIERISLVDMNQFPESEQIYPSTFSAGLTGSVAFTESTRDGQGVNIQSGFFGFVNIGGLRGLNLDFGGVIQQRGDDFEFRREALVGFIDLPERALRFSGGDLLPAQPTLNGSASILGVNMSRRYDQLQPQRLIRPTGRRSFLLEKEATVEVYANNVLVSRFAAGPGPIDLADISVANLSNNVSIIVEDSLGRREVDSFTLSNDVSLIGVGLDQFSVSAGVLRDNSLSGFEYTQDWLLAGSYYRGISERLTLGGFAAATEDFGNVGGSIAFGGFKGVVLFEVAASRSEAGRNGFSWTLAYRGGNFLPQEFNDTLTGRIDYSSGEFSNLSDRSSLSNDRWNAAFDYRFDIGEDTSVLVGVTYDDSHSGLGANRFVSVGVSQRLGAFQFSMTARAGEDSFGRESSGVFFSLSRPLNSRTTTTASYDTNADSARVEVVRNRRIQSPDFNYRLGWQSRSGEQDASGLLGYSGSRFEADARIDRDVGGSRTDRGTTATVRLQSGIGFADGTFAIGRDPGRGFFMIRPHPNLRDADVRLFQGRSRTQPLASTGALGPALAPIAAAYRPTELTVEVANAPPGYDIGNPRFVVLPGARSGVVIPVGTDAYRWRLGTLFVAGRVVPLAYGEITNLDTGEKSTFFTNSQGRASFTGLRPGRYEIRLLETAVRAEFTVLDTDAAFIEMGVINLQRAP